MTMLKKESKRNLHGLRRRSSCPLSDGSFRVAVLGEAGVGKSALTVQFICHRFLSEYDPTLEDTYTKDIVVDGKELKVHVLDTAGYAEEESLSLARESQLKANDAFIIVYSETDRRSLESAESIHSHIVRCCRDRGIQNIPIALVGNKTDLTQCQRVSASEGERLAEELGHRCRHFRTSAARGSADIDAVVDFLLCSKLEADAFPKKKSNKFLSAVRSRKGSDAGQRSMRKTMSLQDFRLKSVQKSILKLFPSL